MELFWGYFDSHLQSHVFNFFCGLLIKWQRAGGFSSRHDMTRWGTSDSCVSSDGSKQDFFSLQDFCKAITLKESEEDEGV